MATKKKIWKWVFDDINSVIKSAHTLPGAFGNLFQNYKHSEFNPNNYDNKSEYTNMILTPVVPNAKFLKSETNYDGSQKVSIDEDDLIQDNSVWFFINGMATSPELSKVNGQKLAEIFKREIHLLYNPSDSVPLDLIECIMDRTFKIGTKVTQSIYRVLIEALNKYDRVVIISHSQGGIITSEVVNQLINDEEYHSLCEKLEIYTFANATNQMSKHEQLSTKKRTVVPHIEHFANQKDFISRIGVLHYSHQVEGRIYTNNSSGHLLNIHYLVQFLNGDFGKTNKLYQYIPQETHLGAEIEDLQTNSSEKNIEPNNHND